MTREEIEEGRELIDSCVRDGSGWDSQIKSSYEAERWLKQHAAELLSLAEEARWRSVTEEPPPALEQVLIDTHVDALPVAYMDPVGLWSDANDEYLSERPTHWRPLPRGPER